MGKGYEPTFFLKKWAKEMSKNSKHKTIKLTERCPISLAIREVQVETG